MFTVAKERNDYVFISIQLRPVFQAVTSKKWELQGSNYKTISHDCESYLINEWLAKSDQMSNES